MEVLDDVSTESVDENEEALKKVLVQQGDEERFSLLGSGLVEEEEKELEAFLQANIDVCSNRQEVGAGVVLVSPNGRILEQFIHLGFKVSTNKAEYEALITGLKLAEAMEADEVVVFCDSQLIVNQETGEYTARDERMITYVKEIVRLLALFQDCRLQQ
ncbi:uncharacterized protein LOC114280718, partial [Camellia sinensis]|uniref:uncharacterized protein LOC114280718 n=1 Tax=Camellia sinensis TaxID=4442 RepID=UPI001035EA4C